MRRDGLRAPGLGRGRGYLGDAMRITALTRLKHAALWEVCKQLGSQSAVARKLDVSAAEFGHWVNLKECPPERPNGRRWDEEKLAKLEMAFMELTGKGIDELWPAEVRKAIAATSDRVSVIERTAEVDTEAYLSYGAHTRERLTHHVDIVALDDSLKDDVSAVLKTLSYREREIIKLRYGIGGDGITYTLEEVGQIFQINKERVRQIEAKALRKLQQPHRADGLRGHVDVVEQGVPCRYCGEMFATASSADSHETLCDENIWRQADG